MTTPSDPSDNEQDAERRQDLGNEPGPEDAGREAPLLSDSAGPIEVDPSGLASLAPDQLRQDARGSQDGPNRPLSVVEELERVIEERRARGAVAAEAQRLEFERQERERRRVEEHERLARAPLLLQRVQEAEWEASVDALGAFGVTSVRVRLDPSTLETYELSGETVLLGGVPGQMNMKRHVLLGVAFFGGDENPVKVDVTFTYESDVQRVDAPLGVRFSGDKNNFLKRLSADPRAVPVVDQGSPDYVHGQEDAPFSLLGRQDDLYLVEYAYRGWSVSTPEELLRAVKEST